MSWPELGALLAVAAAIAFWLDAMRARETAVALARRMCRAEGLLLLDDTVALALLRVRRDHAGRLALLRTYEFEFSDTGNNRLTGSITLLGRDAQTLYLPPRAANDPAASAGA